MHKNSTKRVKSLMAFGFGPMEESGVAPTMT